jgi:hypothetical protein
VVRRGNRRLSRSGPRILTEISVHRLRVLILIKVMREINFVGGCVRKGYDVARHVMARPVVVIKIHVLIIWEVRTALVIH